MKYIGIFLLVFNLSALNSKNISAVLVLDISGSMSVNDPNQMSFESAKLFVDLLSPGDEVSVVLFNDTIANKSDMIPITQDQITSKNKAKALLSNIQYNGSTNIVDAVTTAVDKLISIRNAHPEREFVIILLTDGIDGKSLPEYEAIHLKTSQMGINIHPIALGNEATIGMQLLQALSDYDVLKTDNPKELPSSFATIYGRIFNLYLKPLKKDSSGYSFSIHPLAIDEYIIFGVDSLPGDSTKLFDTNGSEVSSSELSKKGGYFAQEKSYKAFKLKEMITGDNWRIETSYVAKASIIMERPDLEMVTSPGIFDGPAHKIKMNSVKMLSKNGSEVFKNPDFYKNVKFYLVVMSPSGKTDYLLNDDGRESDITAGDFIFGGEGFFSEAGQHTYHIEMRHPSFTLKSDSYFVAFEDQVTLKLLTASNDLSYVIQGQKIFLKIKPTNSNLLTKTPDIFQIRLIPVEAAGWDTINLENETILMSIDSPDASVTLDTYMGNPFLFSYGITPPGKYKGELKVKYLFSPEISVPIEFEVKSIGIIERLFPSILLYSVIAFSLFLIIGMNRAIRFNRQLRVADLSQSAISMHVTSKFLYATSKFKISGDDIYVEATGSESSMKLVYKENDKIKILNLSIGDSVLTEHGIYWFHLWKDIPKINQVQTITNRIRKKDLAAKNTNSLYIKVSK